MIIDKLRAAGCVFAEDEAELLISTARTPDQLQAMVEQRVAGLPLEQVLGWAQFCGLRIVIDPAVFVPRRRTEFLIQQAAVLAGLALAGRAQNDRRTPSPVIVDLCCGSGALGLALKSVLAATSEGTLGPAELYAADLDPAAVRCARRNLEPAGGQVFEGDLYQPLPIALRARIDVLLANAPYVPSAEVGLLPREARIYEPHLALDGGADGLDILRRVVADAPAWLTPGGCLLVETSQRQAPRFADAVTRSGLLPRIVTDDEFGATVVIGLRPSGIS